VRDFLEKKLRNFYVSSISFSRDSKDNYIVNIASSRGGMIAGRDGKGVENLIKDIKKIVRKKGLEAPKDIKVNIEDIKAVYADAGIVTAEVIEGLEKRMPFKRVLKGITESVMREKNVQGVKISLSGRLGGADMARKEFIKKGRIPLSTFRADIDYREGRANLPYGVIGIKV
jgi:small subunit ribosomal protein S3